MTRKESKSPDLEQCVIDLLSENKTLTTRQIIEKVQMEHRVAQEQVLYYILKLKNEEKLTLRDRAENRSLREHIFSKEAAWYWTITAISSFVALNVLFIPEVSMSLSLLRIISGSIFILFLPGYSLIKFLFLRRARSILETFVLSLGTSISLLVVLSYLLYQTVIGIDYGFLVLLLFIFVEFFSTCSVSREYKRRAQ